MLLVQPVPMFALFFCTFLVVLEGKTQHVGHALLLEVDQVCLSHPEPVSLPCFAMNSFSLTLTLARSPANTFAMYLRTSSLVKVRVGDASACWDLDFLGHALHRVGAYFFLALSLSLSFGRAMGRRETPLPARHPAPPTCAEDLRKTLTPQRRLLPGEGLITLSRESGKQYSVSLSLSLSLSLPRSLLRV